DPHGQRNEVHRQIAAYALIGRNVKSTGATASAVPPRAARASSPRRSRRRSTPPATRSTSRDMAGARSTSTPAPDLEQHGCGRAGAGPAERPRAGEVGHQGARGERAEDDEPDVWDAEAGEVAPGVDDARG